MPTRDTGKQRAIRIPLDYYKQPGFLDKWKLRATALALAASLAWWGSEYVFPHQANMKYSRGPVANVHAAWDAKCEACHLPFSPINGNDWAARFMAGGNARAGESLCKGCHGAPDHHLDTLADASRVNNCGSCHRDHQGRMANLSQVADAACTRCHDSLNTHAVHSNFVDRITSFTVDHPEFKFVKKFDKENRTLKFSHQQHMTPGQALTDSASARPWTFDQITNKAEQKRYMSLLNTNNSGDLIQLTCSACHQLDAGDFKPPDESLTGLPKSALLKPRAAGMYFQPVVFEKHCQACHPLNGFDDANRNVTAPHRLQPQPMKEFLKRTYTALFLEDKLAADKDSAKPRPRLDPLDNPSTRTDAQTKIDRKVEKGLANLFGGTKTCLKCHDFRPDPSHITPQEIVTPKPHALWFENAKFDHISHRAVECRSCHPGSDPPQGSASEPLIEKEPLLIPGIDNCKMCHAPRQTVKGVEQGGVRADCSECHLYHTPGKDYWQGLGAMSRDPEGRFDNPKGQGSKLKSGIEQFLSGQPPAKR